MRHASFVAFALCAFGCKEKPTANESPTPKPTTTVIASAAASETAKAIESAPVPVPEHEFLVFDGTVGRRPLRVALDRFENKVEGVVHLTESDTNVRGEIKGKHVTFAEAGAKAGKGSIFDGEIDGSMLRGKWRDPKAKGPETVSAGPPNPFPTKDDAAFEQRYVGTLGTATRIRAKLKKQSDGAISGVYRYAKSREDLKLTGTVDPADGKSALLETDAKGALTGQLRAVFLNRNELFGRWESPDRKRSYLVTLKATPQYPEVVTLASGAKVTPQEEAREPNAFCTVSITTPELVGAGEKVNPALKKFFALEDEASCTSASEGAHFELDRMYKVTAQRKDAIAFRMQSYVYAGGAHGTEVYSCPIADIASGKLVELKPKMLTPEGRKALDARVSSSLRQDESFDQDTSVSDTTTLCVEGNDLVVQFQVYEVGAYAIGAPLVKVPGKLARTLFQPSELIDTLFPN